VVGGQSGYSLSVKNNSIRLKNKAVHRSDETASKVLNLPGAFADPALKKVKNGASDEAPFVKSY
jgi:hypothetical protein